MTTTQKDGGQAYPAAWGSPEQGGDYVPGMTLRDWLAGQALVGLPHLCAHDTLLDGITFEQHVARNAYRMADAMLAAREAAE